MSSRAASVISLSSLGVAAGWIAANGERFIASMSSGWNLIVDVAARAPLGLSTVFLAWGLGVLLTYSLRRWWPEPEGRAAMHWRMGVIEFVAAACTFAVCWLQIRSGLGLLLGAIAGLSVSLIFRAVATGLAAVLAKRSDS